jgi:ABC-2 type transport system ATP-binding protein
MSALTADGLTRRFGDLVAVNNLKFEVPDGIVVGFVGPNGSGKSTTIGVLLGLIDASAGTGTVLGEPIEDPERFADRVGTLIENPALVGSLSGRDISEAWPRCAACRASASTRSSRSWA